MSNKTYLNPTREHMQALAGFPDNEAMCMINLLKFKDRVAETGLTGWETYRQYMKATTPFIAGVEAKMVFFGSPMFTVIGPIDEALWDKVLIVEYKDKASFYQMLQMEGYPHEIRTSSLLDSRLIACRKFSGK